VINDGSTDSTGAILEKYGNRVQVITQCNCGVSVARNAGICRSTGKYLVFLDTDDLWLPGKLVAMVQALERNPGASLAFSEYRNIDENGADIGASTLGHAPSMEELTTLPLPAIMPST
jgi:glycosyltransferase involved in cell wall biosynthesis